MARYDDFRRGRYEREFRGGSQRGGQTGYSRGSDGYPLGVNLDRVDAERYDREYRQPRPRGGMNDRPYRGSGAVSGGPYHGRGDRGRRGYGDRDYSPWLKYVPREYDRGYRW